MKRYCPKCRIVKDESEYYKTSKNNIHGGVALRGYCKKCWNKNNEKYAEVWRLKRIKNAPWYGHYMAARKRCRKKYGLYYRKKIKCFLTLEDVKRIWLRDKAWALERPSLDREDSRGDYTAQNCRFIEWIENCRQGGLNRWKNSQ